MVRVRAIGILESCFREKFATPRQPQLAPGSAARLRIHEDFLPEHSLKGLEGFSHIWLLPYFHLNTNKNFLSKIHPPRLQGKTIGVFASRSPHRPSAIGLTLTRLVAIEGDTLYLAGIDLVEGTPILDIKPYIPASDEARGARSGWTSAIEPRELAVSFSQTALDDLGELEQGKAAALKALILEVLRHDPRNPRDRSQMREGKDLAFLLMDRDVRFKVHGRAVTVLRVEPGQPLKKSAPGPALKPGL